MPEPLLAALSGRIGLPDGSDVPEAFKIFPAGEVRIDGMPPVRFTAESAELVLAEFDNAEAEMVVDYEHQTLSGGKAPAAGWIGRLEARADGLWAVDVRWTEEAAAYLERGEYRYLSPVFEYRAEDRVVTRLYNVGLTNQPRMLNVAALAAKLTPGTPDATGGTDTASEIASDPVSEPASEPNSNLDAGLRLALELPEEADTEAALIAVVALKGRVEMGDRAAREVAALKAELAGLRAAHLLDDACREGRLTPAEVEVWAGELALSSPDSLTAILKTRPEGSMVPTGGAPFLKDPLDLDDHLHPEHPLDDDQLAICNQLGISPQAYLKTFNKEA